MFSHSQNIIFGVQRAQSHTPMAYEKHHESNSLAALARQVAAAAAAGTLPPPRVRAAPPAPARTPTPSGRMEVAPVKAAVKRRAPEALAPPAPVLHWSADDRAAAVSHWLEALLPVIRAGTLSDDAWYTALTELEARACGRAPDISHAASTAAAAAANAPPTDLGGVAPAVQAALLAFQLTDMVGGGQGAGARPPPSDTTLTTPAAAFAAAFEDELDAATATSDGHLLGLAVAALVGEGEGRTDAGDAGGVATVGGL